MAKPTKVRPPSAEFSRADLGDERLTRRLMTVGDIAARAPASSFTEMVTGDGELEGIYRVFSNETVTPPATFAPHFAETRRRIGDSNVLVVHDTTSFVFGGNQKRPGLGRFKSGLYQGALAVFAVIAWRLLLLRHVVRDDPNAPATEVLSPRQVRVLERLASMKGDGIPVVKLPAKPTAADALMAVAKLGGHLTKNGQPGWQVLGRGYESMLLIELGWRAALATYGEK